MFFLKNPSLVVSIGDIICFNMFDINMCFWRLYFLREYEAVHYFVLILGINISKNVGIPVYVL